MLAQTSRQSAEGSAMAGAVCVDASLSAGRGSLRAAAKGSGRGSWLLVEIHYRAHTGSPRSRSLTSICAPVHRELDGGETRGCAAIAG